MMIKPIKLPLMNSVYQSIIQKLQPPSLGKIATKLPSSINRKLVAKLLNNAFIEQISEGDFDFLNHRKIQIEIIDAVLFIGLEYDNTQLICSHLSSIAQSADATLSLNSIDAIQLIEQDIDPDTLFFQRKLKIKGDTELAHQLKNTIDRLDPSRLPTLFLSLLNLYKEKFLR